MNDAGRWDGRWDDGTIDYFLAFPNVRQCYNMMFDEDEDEDDNDDLISQLFLSRSFSLHLLNLYSFSLSSRSRIPLSWPEYSTKIVGNVSLFLFPFQPPNPHQSRI